MRRAGAVLDARGNAALGHALRVVSATVDRDWAGFDEAFALAQFSDRDLLARTIFAEAGCDVDGTRVRFSPGFCRRTITATAPAQYLQHARNPANTVQMGGSATVLCPSWGPPFVHDLDRGRRYATYEDFQTLVKLHQTLHE